MEVLEELSIAHLLQRERVETRNRSRLTKLVEMIIALENGESRGNGPVKQVRFRKPEGVKPLEGPELGLHAERLPQAQEIVGGVVDADKVARNPADAAREADGVSPLLLHLHVDVDRALLLVLLDVVVFLLDRIKEAELVEAQGAVVPQRRAEELALVQQQLPPDHLVSGLGIPGELDAMDKELLLFVEVQRQVDQELFVIALGIGGGHEVDVTELPVELLVVFEGLPHLREIENIAALHLQDGRELFLLEQLVAADDELAQPVLRPFLQGNGEVHALAAPPAPEKGRPVLGIGHLDLRLLHQGGEVSVVLVEAADLFQVIIDFILVVGLVEPVEPRRRAEGLRVLHGALQREIGKHRVALKANVAHLDLGAFHDDKGQSHRVRRDVPRAGAHAGELPAVFRQELLQDNFGALDHDGVILGLNRQPHLALLEPVEHVGRLHAAQALVVDTAHQLLLPNEKSDDLARLAVANFQADVIQKAGVPERHEVALERALIVHVALLGKDPGAKSGGRDAAVAAENDAFNNRGFGWRSGGRSGGLAGLRRRRSGGRHLGRRLVELGLSRSRLVAGLLLPRFFLGRLLLRRLLVGRFLLGPLLIRGLLILRRRRLLILWLGGGCRRLVGRGRVLPRAKLRRVESELADQDERQRGPRKRARNQPPFGNLHLRAQRGEALTCTGFSFRCLEFSRSWLERSAFSPPLAFPATRSSRQCAAALSV